MNSMKPHQSIRIFQSPVLEALTHVHPIIPLVIWAPIVTYHLFHSVVVDQLAAGPFALMIALGLLFWTLTEYGMHRYVFHFNATTNAGKYLVWLFHGVHHDDPQDPTRLVMPPVVSLILGTAFYYLFVLLMGEVYARPFFSAFIAGYLAYDYIHFATHHFRPRTEWGKGIKENHMKHHYLKKGGKWGVSSTLWDHVFGTFQG
jgi:sterol desaturase/sphingolipid hydroxylase (fatty acid hydroxylase superfamily)